MLEIYRDYYEKNADEATLRRFLRAPVAIRARVDLSERLKKMLEGKLKGGELRGKR